MEELYNKLGFKQWFSDYSESNHHLKGWRDRDEYLDEVELQKEITLTLLQNWLKEVHKIDVLVNKTLSGSYLDIIWEGTEKIKKSGRYNSYERALKSGICKSLKLIIFTFGMFSSTISPTFFFKMIGS